MADEPAPAKTHTAFVQVVLRKTGEAADLAGKAVFGLSGLNLFVTGAHTAEVDRWRVAACLALGGGLIAMGIYLQAKAEETR